MLVTVQKRPCKSCAKYSAVVVAHKIECFSAGFFRESNSYQKPILHNAIETNFKIDKAEDPRVFSWFEDLTTRFGSIHSVLEPIILKEKNFII